MKKVILSLLLSTSLLALIGCGQPQQASTTQGGGASANKTLVMATSADYPPYEYHDTSSGGDVITGFDVDLAKAITKQLGYNLQIQDVSFDGLVPALQSKRYDFVMAAMEATPERKKSVDFSDTYFLGGQAIVFRKDAPVANQKELNGKKVGAQLGSVSEKAAKKIQGANIDSLNKTNDIIMELKDKRIDAAVIAETVAKSYIQENPDLGYIPMANNDDGNAVAFPKGSNLVPGFDKAIQQLKANGQLDQLVKKYFN